MKHLFLVLALSGCATYGTQITPQQSSAIRPGESKQDVIKGLGKQPDIIRTSGDITSIGYVYATGQVDGKSWIPIVGPLIGKTHYKSTTVFFSFDQAGKFTDSKTEVTETNAGLGD